MPFSAGIMAHLTARRSRALSYGLGAGYALVAYGLGWAAQPWLGDRLPFLFFLPVLTLCAATLGRGPALLVLAVGAVAGVLRTSPLDEWPAALADEPAILGAYLVVGLGMLLLGGRVRLIRRRVVKAEQRLALAQHETGVGLFEIDFKSRSVFVSPAMTELLGHPGLDEELSLARWAQLLLPEELEQGRGMLQQMLREGTDRHEREHSITLADGRVRWLMSRLHIERAADGSARRLRGACVDISHRKELESALRQTRDDLTQQVADLQRLHDLSSELPELPNLASQLEAALRATCDFHGVQQGIVWLLDEQSPRLVVNASLGFRAATLERLGAVPAGHGASGIACNERCRTVVANTHDDPRFAEYTALAEDAGFRAVHSTPLLSPSGEVMGAISVHFAKPRQPTLREMRLADICARKATVFIERDRAQQALREADRRKDEFLATLAHELRNPLAPIRQAAVISRAPGASEAQKRWSHEVIDRQVQQMALLLDDLLDVSRITRGMLQLRKAPTELAALIDAAVETARPLIDAKRHQLLIEIPQDVLWLDVDPLRIAQVIANLLANAAKYTDPQGRIRVSAHLRGDEIAIEVTDNGIGLKRESLGEIFQMFTQVRGPEDRSAGGLGIGLALARGLVVLHGGRISVRSEGPGHGSIFTVVLPRGTTAAAPVAALRPGDSITAPARKVLVADDNRDAAETLAELLRLDGHEVAVAFDGEAALMEFERFRPDVALIDIGMPKMNGNAVAGAIRQSPAGRQTTLVAVTGWGQDKDRSEALAAGFDHHLTKPVDPQRVQRLMHAPPSA